MKQMSLLLPLKRSFLLATLAIVILAAPPVHAEEKDLQDTLLRMEQLLEQQQKELEAQRKELAEQRTLIRQLQEAQNAGAGERESLPVEESKTTEPRLAEAGPASAEPAAQPDERSGAEQAKAEFDKREQEGTAAITVEQTVIEEDPSNTVYDKDFPGAWHLPGTTSAMKIGGYVNLALVNSFDPLRISDRFIVGSIPPDGEDVPGAKAGTTVTANQTRINFEVREATSQGPLRAFIEADFEGQGDTFRLRHAFGQFRWMLAGKTWSTLMDIDSRAEEVDFEGINGMVLVRQAQLRIFPQFGRDMSFKLSLEDPQTDVANGIGARGNADLIASLDRLPLGQLGSWNSRVAFILRDLEAETTGPDIIGNQTANAWGWGVTTSGRKPISWWGENDFLLWQVTYGKGIGRYLNDLGTVGGGDAVFDPRGELRPLPVFAGYVSYRHRWPKDFWFLKSWPGILRSNLTLSWVDINNFDFQDDKDYNSTVRASANLIYLPTNNVRFGAELLWGERKNKDNSKGTAVQVQVSARYNF